MYFVYQDGRKVGRNKFNSYEAARSYVRRKIREATGNWSGKNPPIADFGFSIKAAGF